MNENGYAHPHRLVPTEWVAAHSGDPQVRLIEVDVDTAAYATGHILGAQNIPWASAVAEDGTFKPASELRSIYGGKGVTPETATIAYCRIGERSAHTWFVLTELLGYPDVRNYDGSWTEWGSLIGAPIER